jgi:hypothetical protein
MSMSRFHTLQAARLHSAADRLEMKGDSQIHAAIARRKATIHAMRAETAKRWEKMAKTPLEKRPGGFPGDPFNQRDRVANG